MLAARIIHTADPVRAERVAALTGALKEAGLAPQLVPGVDRREPGWREQCGVSAEGAFSTRTWRAVMGRQPKEHAVALPMLDGEIACAQAHINAVRLFLASGEAHGCIFEDDAKMVCSPSAAREVLDDWLAFSKQEPTARSLLLYRGGRDRSHTEARVDPHQPQHRFKRCLDAQFGLVGYVVNRAGAELMLAAWQPIRMPCDKVTADRALELGIYMVPWARRVVGVPTVAASLIEGKVG